MLVVVDRVALLLHIGLVLGIVVPAPGMGGGVSHGQATVVRDVEWGSLPKNRLSKS